eukprot:TRINITY_DN21314_c0_g2_i1.p1 TRINITY_DN21314_c0_g2~~TRINITY_DN21314_c0_g2_i1.p1  ORF type:complete len:262 (-),score=75.69 TRINITY_DN21314_c0_g2_i1:80-865(-)
MAEAGDDAAELHLAVRKLLLARKDEFIDAGPKAVLAALQSEDEKWSGISAPKCKRVLQAVRAEITKREADALARRKTKWDCPGGHGLARFMTHHASFCCDVCRCYVNQGAGMWGCRECDWDVCEQKCRPKDTQGLVDLEATLTSLEKRVEAARRSIAADEKTALAQLESEVHQLEKALDAADLSVLVKTSLDLISEEDARKRRKELLKCTEELLESIERRFKVLRDGGGDAEEKQTSAAEAGGYTASEAPAAPAPREEAAC